MTMFQPLVAYIDSSVLVAIAFSEPDAEDWAERLSSFSRWISANLLDAEVRAVFSRERLVFDAKLTSQIERVLPDRTLEPEIAHALEFGGYLRGADLWHVAMALYASDMQVSDLAFLTKDIDQRNVAARLGFLV